MLSVLSRPTFLKNDKLETSQLNLTTSRSCLDCTCGSIIDLGEGGRSTELQEGGEQVGSVLVPGNEKMEGVESLGANCQRDAGRRQTAWRIDRSMLGFDILMFHQSVGQIPLLYTSIVT